MVSTSIVTFKYIIIIICSTCYSHSPSSTISLINKHCIITTYIWRNCKLSSTCNGHLRCRATCTISGCSKLQCSWHIVSAWTAVHITSYTGCLYIVSTILTIKRNLPNIIIICYYCAASY